MRKTLILAALAASPSPAAIRCRGAGRVVASVGHAVTSTADDARR